MLKFLPLLLLTGCLFSGPPSNPQELAEKYEVVQGLRVAPPDLLESDERLDIFIGVPAEVQSEWGPTEWTEVLFCIASNRGEDPLPEIQQRINESPEDKLIYLYGKRITEPSKFWIDGPDFQVKAVAVWHVKGHQYVYYKADWKTPWYKYLSMRAALKKAVEKGVDAGAGAVVP